MSTPRAACPKCSNKLVWNGSGMVCISCPYVAPDVEKAKSEKKIPSPRKSK
jgi:hypothetical protein